MSDTTGDASHRFFAIGSDTPTANECERTIPASETLSPESAPRKAKTGEPPTKAFEQVGIERYTVSLASDIAKGVLIDEYSDATLARFNDVRREVARETGIVLYGIHLRDDSYLKECQYTIHVGDTFIAKNTLKPGYVIALGTTAVLELIEGIETKEPVYGLAGKWIPSENLQDAKEKGAMVFDNLSILASHVGQVARDTLYTVYNLQQHAALLHHLNQKVPAIIEEFSARVPRYMGFLAYKALLREYIWPRDPIGVIADMTEASLQSCEPRHLAEAARKNIVGNGLMRKKIHSIQVLKLSDEIEHIIAEHLRSQDSLIESAIGIYLRKEIIAEHKKKPTQTYVLTSPKHRYTVAELFFYRQKAIPVFAKDEIPKSITFKILREITAPISSELDLEVGVS